MRTVMRCLLQSGFSKHQSRAPCNAPPSAISRAALCNALLAPGGRQVTVHSAPLASPALSYLWDHQVSGKPLFPGAGYFELAAVAAKTLLTLDASAALLGVTIPAPLVLPSVQPTKAGQQGAAALIACRLDAPSGAVEVASGQRSVHMRATASTVGQIPSRNSPSRLTGQLALLRSIAATRLQQVAAEPAYVGDIDDSAHHATDVFLSPAVLDCCLHLGALPAAAAGQLKVPAGIQTLLLPAAAQSSSNRYTAAALQLESSPAASLVDYSLLVPAGPSACTVSGLQAKPLGVQPRAAAAAGAAVAGDRLLYVVSWAAQQPAEQAITPVPSGATAAAMAVCRDATALCSTGMAAFQVAATEQQGSLCLATTASQPQLSIAPAMGSASSAASLLWGMLRSVALEHTSATATATDVDSLAAAHGSSAASATALLCLAAAAAAATKSSGDAYGRAERGGLSFAATLLPSAVPAAAALGGSTGQLQAIKAAKGRIAVTGGMGSLGSILSSWVDAAQLATELVLLGRTGRLAGSDASPGLTGLLARSSTALTLAMTDLAGSEGSTAALGAAAGTRTAPLAALFHSGGVLVDATLANQAPAGIRAVFAAKVSAAIRWRGALQVQPAAAEVLFSSVAALLGSGGQTNYSAANAALDAMATNLQQQVGKGAVMLERGECGPALCFFSECFNHLFLNCRPYPPSPCAGPASSQCAVGCLVGRRHGGPGPLHRPARAAHGHGND